MYCNEVKIRDLEMLLKVIDELKSVINVYYQRINEIIPGYTDDDIFTPRELWRRRKLNRTFKSEFDDIYKLREELEDCLEFYRFVTTYKSGMLMKYFDTAINKVENDSYYLSMEVTNKDGVLVNQKIINYLRNFSDDPLLPFSNFCDDKEVYYHILLPKENYIKSFIFSGKSICEIPVMCFPKGEKITVMDDKGNVLEQFKKFPGLEESIFKLVEYGIKNDDLSKKEFVQKATLQDNKNNYQYVKRNNQ